MIIECTMEKVFLQISPDTKYTETNIGQPVECANDVCLYTSQSGDLKISLTATNRT